MSDGWRSRLTGVTSAITPQNSQMAKWGCGVREMTLKIM